MAQAALQVTGPRVEEELRLLSVRDLTEADMEIIQTMPRDQETSLERITNRHHALARNLAQGLPPGQAGAATGYTANRVSILLEDPTFKELIEFYRQSVDDAFLEAQRELAGVMRTGAQVLSARLERDLEAGEKGEEEQMGTSTVLEIVTALADRTGHGVSSVQTTVTVDLATRMRERREAARRAATELAGQARDITPQVAAE